MKIKNVDGLHQKALLHGARQSWPDSRLKENILELHGTLHVRVDTDLQNSIHVLTHSV